MHVIPMVYAASATTGLTNPASKITTFSIAGILTGGGFNLVSFIFAIIGLVFLGSLIMAGWDYLLSSGDPKKIAAASTRITNSLIGLLLCFTAFIIVNIITNMIGLGSQF